MVNNRADCTLGRPCQPRDRRERLNCLVHHSPQTARELADAIGRRYDRLLAYASVNDSAQMPIGDLIQLTLVTGRTFALQAEVEACGFLMVPQPHGVGSDPIAELVDVFASTGQLAESHRSHVAARAPETLRDVIASARTLQTEVAEFISAAESDVPRSLKVAR
jgi:hypothetical protein